MPTMVPQTCTFCKKVFNRKIAEAKRVKTPFCSYECVNKHKKRILYKIDENGCWICTSHAPGLDGYCATSFKGKLIKMHRYMYEKYKGKIPEGLLLRHKCDVRNCINPDHLIPGTDKDNNRDMWERGRAVVQKGEEKPNARLTEAQVREIREAVVDLTKYYTNKFNLSYKTVFDVVFKRTWKHVVVDSWYSSRRKKKS